MKEFQRAEWEVASDGDQGQWLRNLTGSKPTQHAASELTSFPTSAQGLFTQGTEAPSEPGSLLVWGCRALQMSHELVSGRHPALACGKHPVNGFLMSFGQVNRSRMTVSTKRNGENVAPGIHSFNKYETISHWAGLLPGT